MKSLLSFCILGIVASLVSSDVYAAITPKNNLLGKFLVSSVKGDVTCVSSDRILELKKGDTLQGRGAIVRTGAGAHVTLVFSNGTGVYVDEKTNFEVVKFDQEFFAPNNNLRVEPSNSSTIVKLDTGRLVISTPRLVSGTTMVYQTPHAAVGIRGEKILVEASEQQTHVAIIEGLATVNVRDQDGEFVSIGTRLTTGKEAFVKRAWGGETDQRVAAVEGTAADPTKSDASAASAKSTEPVAAKPGATQALPSIVKDVEALVLNVSGTATVKLPGSSNQAALEPGVKLTRGASISTDDNSQVELQPFEGAVATLQPKSTVLIEGLSITTAGVIVQKQSAILLLKAGSLVSTIDPSKRYINDYSVRTPKGIASAKGTSFVASVDGDSATVSATADTVSFLIPDGSVYQITAGLVSITPSGDSPQAPIPIASAIAANPGLSALIQAAFTTVASLVQKNTGGFSAESGTNLLVKVASTAALALPTQAPAIAAQAVTAVTAGTSATAVAGSAAAAVATITQAISTAVPAQAAQIAASAAAAAPSHAVTIAGAVAKGAPAQAAQIAKAVTLSIIHLDADGAISQGSIQTGAAVAAAVAGAVPNQAPPAATAVLQALAQAAPRSTAVANATIAAIISSSTTTAVPAQAAPVASAVMKTLTTTATFAGVSTQIVAQSAALIASGVTSVVPDQAQSVATAVMQILVDANPKANPAAISQLSGTLAAAVAEAAPSQSAGIFEGVATASNQKSGAVASSAARFRNDATGITAQIAQINLVAGLANQQSIVASQAITAGALLSQDKAATGVLAADTSNSSTSIIITQFDPSVLGPDMDSLQSAQSEVIFDTGPDGKGGTTVVPVFTSPAHPPVEFLVSPSRKNENGKDKNKG